MARVDRGYEFVPAVTVGNRPGVSNDVRERACFDLNRGVRWRAFGWYDLAPPKNAPGVHHGSHLERLHLRMAGKNAFHKCGNFYPSPVGVAPLVTVVSRGRCYRGAGVETAVRIVFPKS